MLYWLNLMGKKKGNILELYAKPLNDIPIKEASANIKKQLIDLVNIILDLKKESLDAYTLDLERRIDRIVYDIYDLTEAEIKLIEQSV